MDLEDVMVSERSHSMKNKYHMISLLYMESNEHNELMNKRVTRLDA